jgi:uncharacterized lipoprotein YddW (UPF0748 family)
VASVDTTRASAVRIARRDATLPRGTQPRSQIMRVSSPGRALVWMVGALVALAGSAVRLDAQPRSEVRGFWVDTFNTTLNTHTDVANVVAQAVAANANTIFAQVRRRGDSWYLNSLEPLADRTPIQPAFDPLQDLILEAHTYGLDVHAFVIVNAIWNRAPSLFPPTDPGHAFNLHGGYDPATNTIAAGPGTWLTRTLIPDGTAAISLQGHRFGSEFYIDAGHPDAAKYTVDVLMHLVRHYDLDGLHLDRIRYPDISIAGQTPSTGTTWATTPRASPGSSAGTASRRAPRRRRRTTRCGASGAAIRSPASSAASMSMPSRSGRPSRSPARSSPSAPAR